MGRLSKRARIEKLLYNKLIMEVKMLKQNVETGGNLEVINDRLRLHIKAMELFGKDECFWCHTAVLKSNITIDPKNIRMFNIGPNKLIEKNWFTLCNKCYSNLNIKDKIKEIINEPVKRKN